MDKIVDALKKLLPEDQIKDVASAVEEAVNSAKSELDTEYSAKLEQAYGELTAELKEAEKVAEHGYQEAFAIIQDLRNRLEMQRKEFETALEEGYEEAYQMLLDERSKKDGVESNLYEEYDKKLAEMKEHMIDKIDQFLQLKGKEIYEQAVRDVSNDPAMVEHKVTLSKIVETVADYITDEEYALATSTRLEEAQKGVDDLRGQVRLLEARNIRLSTENQKLNENVRHTAALIKEHAETTDKKERAQKAQNATGRGKTDMDGLEVIRETASTKPAAEDDEGSEPLNEDARAQFHDWAVLSGIKQSK